MLTAQQITNLPRFYRLAEHPETECGKFEFATLHNEGYATLEVTVFNSDATEMLIDWTLVSPKLAKEIACIEAMHCDAESWRCARVKHLEWVYN